MQAFYDAITPRAEAAMTYLDQYTLDDLPPEALNLMHLLYSMIMVSFPVECWHQPRIPDSGVADLRVGRGARTMSDTIVLRADRWVDIDAGEVRSPAVIVVEGNRIVGVNPDRRPDRRDRDRPRRRHAPARAHGHGAQPPHRRPRRRRGFADPDARRPGRPGVPHAVRHGERQDDAARGFTTVRNLGPDGEDRRLHARRVAHARHRPGLDRRSRASSRPATRSRRTAATSIRRCSSASRPGSCP